MENYEKIVEEVLSKLNASEKTKEVAAKGTDVDSLESFYKVRDSHGRRGKKVHTYYFNEDIHKEQGLILLPITDVHLGNRHANIPYFKRFVKYILDTPNAVTVLNGDLAETATKVSVGMAMFEEDMNIPEQLDTLYEILKPLADAGKILGMGPGNHEERVANMIGINPMKILADKLGVPYFGYQGFFRIVVNGIVYKCTFFHGAGGGATVGSKANTAEKMNKVIGNADLYFSGHTHGKQSHQDVIYMMDEESDELIPHIRTYVVGGSFVEYWGAYPEMKALAPSITGLVRCELRPDRKDIRVIV
jgi:DNA polymerase II small subunit/DNA polymerase delta subunit B